MTQASSSQTLSIQLTPMRIPEAVPLAGLMVSGPAELAGMQLELSSLLLHPGEPSEMIVQVKNLSRRTVWLNLRVEGNFPAEWYRIGMEGHELAPGQQMDAVLYFQVPSTYFEDQEAIDPRKKSRLALDFRNRIYFYYGHTSTNLDQVEHSEFSLHIRAHSLYLNFLPTLFREVDFIGRFLKIFEETFEPTVHSLQAMWANLDPLTAPRGMLPFLAHWVAWPIDRRWELPQQRRLIKRAVELYRWRGTRQGLRLYLHLYTGLPLDEQLPEENKHIRIADRFGRGFVLGTERLGQGTMIGGGRPFHFVVTLREMRPNQVNERLVRLIIEQEKPAFCTYELFIEAAPPQPAPPKPGGPGTPPGGPPRPQNPQSGGQRQAPPAARPQERGPAPPPAQGQTKRPPGPPAPPPAPPCPNPPISKEPPPVPPSPPKPPS